MGAETELFWIADHASKQNMGPENGSDNEFPAGLRVLVVDDDRICLLILDRMLRQCLYKVKTCERAVDALKILRENKDGFDLVISDVHMPDMDGFKLLELVGLEMDLPVIMMSANGETSAVMKGIKHGACDYLLKPVRIEELKNIWQHVIRRKKKDVDSFDDRHRPDDGGDALANDGLDGPLKTTKKRKDNQEEDDDFELENEDPATSKKPRVVWSVDLHQKFVNAVNQLGIDKAVPKRILELMDVRGLTRENVASHLQKYRLYLKRISGVAHHAGGGLGVGLFGADERFMSTGSGLGDFRTHLSPHGLIPSLHAGLLDRAGPINSDPFFIGQVPTIHSMNNGSTGGPPYVNTANVLNSVTSSGLDFKHLGRGIGQLVSLGHNDRVPGLPLSAGTHMERLISHDNRFLADHNNSSLLMQILQQQTSSQMANGMLSETPINAQNMSSSEAGSSLSKISSTMNTLGSFCRPNEEAVNLSSYGLAPFRKTKVVDVRPYNHALQVGISNYALPSSLPSQSIPPGNEINGGLSEKGGLICNPSENRNQGLQSVLTDQASGNMACRSGAGLSNWQSWHDVGPNQDVGGHSSVSLANSNYNQGLAPGQATKMGNMQQQKFGWVHKFHSDLVEDVDAKPLVTSRIPLFEQGLGEGDNLKSAHMDSLVGSKTGAYLETSLSSDDLLTSYIKQQQQEMMNLTESGATTEDYTLGNMYVK